MFCSKCGSEIPDESKFCQKCGANLNSQNSSSKLKKKISKKILIAISAVIIVVLVCIIGGIIYSKPSVKYALAETAFANENYARAVKLYTAVGDYEDAQAKLEEATILEHYNLGMRLYEKKDFEAAIVEFTATNGYEDSEGMIEECNYHIGLQYYEISDYFSAAEALSNSNGYLDAEEKIIEIGEIYLNNKDYENAKEIFGLADDKKYANYVQGVLDLNDKNYKSAYENLKKSAGIYDSNELYTDVTYNYAYEKFSAGDYSDAKKLFQEVASYKDAGGMLNACDLMLAKEDMDKGNLNTAKSALEQLPSDYVYNNVSVEDLLDKINSHSEWLAICGKWSSTSGEAKSTQRGSYSSNWWTADLNESTYTMEIRCIINDDSSVTVKGGGNFYIMTNYSSISAGLKSENHVFSVNNKMSGLGSVSIDEYTTLNISSSQLTVAYEKVDNAQDVYFTYIYETDLVFGKKISSY